MFEFRKLTSEHLEKVLLWRTKPSVTRQMFTDVENDLNEQRKWFSRMQLDQTLCYWMISYQNKDIGVLNLADINRQDKSCSWGFYIGDDEFSNLGGLVPPYLYNYLFQESDIETLYADVFQTNNSVLKLHHLHGYQNLNKDYFIEKNGARQLVTKWQLDKSTWQTRKRFQRYRAHFDSQF